MGINDTINFLKGLSQEEIQKTRDEVLNTKLSDLVKYSEMFEKLASKMKLTVVGSDSAIKSNEELFDNISSSF